MENCMGLRQSVAWWCFVPERMSPEALVKAAAELGYDAIELAEPEYWQLIKDHGLNISSRRAHDQLTNGLNRRENYAQIERELIANLKLAEHWNIPDLICFSGNRNGLADDVGAEITAENLSRLAKLVENTGVTLTLELLNSKVDHPDYQCDKSAWGLKVIQMVDSPSVRLLYDIYHMQIMEGDIISTIQQNHVYFAHYHTAGNPGRHELDDRQELNYLPIIRAIVDSGYMGYLGQEFIPTGDPVAGLKAAFELCHL